MSRRAALTAVVLLSLAMVALAGCGRRGAPVAPELRVPDRVGDLGATVGAHGIALTWTNPERRVDRSRLRDLRVARVFRAEDGAAAEPRSALLDGGRIPGYREVATVRLDAPAPAVVEAGRVTVVDRGGLTGGRRYTYVVVTEDATGRTSPPSARVVVTFIAAPEPPRDVVAEAGERQVRLAWQPPARLVDGSPAGTLTYEVLRGPSPDALARLPGLPITATGTVDTGLENERTYHYAVRAVRTEGGTTAVSERTAPVTATPVDLTPPSPPYDLVAIPSARTVRLSWLPSGHADVVRYIVYRARDGEAFIRVGSVDVPTTTYTDRDVPPGRYRYAVTAQDASRKGNESGRSNEATVAVP